ncbi:uncharacterized protein LOC129729636 [Wyeomyia smithii]|uniref:uncharacterized protein LOC129729636 n=1 Tax=Wyeomyia smithii TaxID=174621 RepID=UPI002467F6D1|nr:uncharacterized protein LOC129729636 [Wyeomyia smithii]
MWASFIRNSETPASPTGSYNRSLVGERSTCKAPACSTQNKWCSEKDEYLPLDEDESPILLSQETVNSVTGVTWAWNSPKRATTIGNQKRPRNLLFNNVVRKSGSSETQRKKTLTGFYKFQSELKLLQESNKSPVNGLNSEVKEGCVSVPTFSPKVTIGSVNNDICSSHTNVPQKCWESDSFNNSELDRLLLEATQQTDNQFSTRVCAPVFSSNEVNKENSFVKSRTKENFDSNCDLLNDSEFDAFLIQASQEVESCVSRGIKIGDEIATTSKRGTTISRHKSMQESSSSKPDICSRRVEEHFNNIQEPSMSSDIKAGATQKPIRRCTKEEIEQKRQEALKRLQERRMKLLSRERKS